VAASPTDEMLGLLSGYWYSQVLYVLAELGIADRLAAGPKTAETLARETACHAATLGRFLRAVASAGILRELDPGTFSLTPLSETLRTDRPGSLRPVARLGGHPLHWQAWGDLLHSVRTGATAFEAVHGRSFFDALAEDSALSLALQGGLDRLHDVDREVVEALDLGRFERIVDVGGGGGELSRRLARARPGASVVLFDRPHVIAMVAAAPGVEHVAGNFLDSVPRGRDAYVLKFVLHDWDDARAARILKNCRDAMPAEGRVFVVEVVVPGSRASSIAKTHDLNMLVLTGGRERTLDEYQVLLSAAGLELVRTSRLGTGVDILEARVA